jgi:hypothetical protein
MRMRRFGWALGVGWLGRMGGGGVRVVRESR